MPDNAVAARTVPASTTELARLKTQVAQLQTQVKTLKKSYTGVDRLRADLSRLTERYAALDRQANGVGLVCTEPLTVGYPPGKGDALKIGGHATVDHMTVGGIAAIGRLGVGERYAKGATPQKQLEVAGDVAVTGRVDAKLIESDSGYIRHLRSGSFFAERVVGRDLVNASCPDWTKMAAITFTVDSPVSALLIATATALLQWNQQTSLAFTINDAVVNPWNGAGVVGGANELRLRSTYIPISSLHVAHLQPGVVRIEAVVKQTAGTLDVQCGQLIVVTMPA